MSGYFDKNINRISDGTTARDVHVNVLRDEVGAGFDKLPSEAYLKTGTVNYAVDNGVANAYVVALPYPPAGLVDGLEVKFRAANTNTGASTLDIGLGAVALKRGDNTHQTTGDIQAGSIITTAYSSTYAAFVVTSASRADVAAAAASAVAAAGSAGVAEFQALSAEDQAIVAAEQAVISQKYAAKTDDYAVGTENSSKSWAIGGAGNGQPDAGDAKSWATRLGSVVVAGAYSAKEWAVGTFLRGAAGGGSAKDWATYVGGKVDDTEYSAKKYALDVAAQAAGLVSGPSSSLDRRIAVFSGTTGKLLTDSGLTLSPANDIGTPGTQGFGAGICPTPPPGFTELSGTRDKASDNYGNYLYQDGSVMVWVPLFYYRIAHASNPTYATYLLNSIDIKPESYFADVPAANAAGYVLHRAFRDGGATKRGVFVDKYGCSNNAGVASSIRYGKPLSTAADHNPINALNGAPALTYAGAIDAAKTRGTMFACCSRFIHAALALLSMAHAQASVSTTFCAWYDTTYNFPKGNNNNALHDTNDAAVTYVSDGYSNCGKTGSGVPFEKTTHNGQASGVADLNGNMYEISLGLTRPGTTSTEAINDALGTTKFHILRESVALANLTSGWNTGNDHWGTDAFLDTNFQEIDLPHITVAGGYVYLGNGANQVLSEAVSGNNWLMTGLGIHKDANGASAGGTNIFGTDGIYRYHMSNLCVLSGGFWSNAAPAGVWLATLSYYRSASYDYVGFRAACYFV